MAAASKVRDFDVDRNNRLRNGTVAPQFKIGGQLFKMRLVVRPDVIAEAEELTGDAGPKKTVELIDNVILAFIDPAKGAHERYAKVRADEEDPVTLQDLLQVMWWCVETYASRPTVPSSPSTPGRRRTTTRSTAGSPSKAQT